MRDIFIPANAKVICTDGQAGFVSTIVVNPVRREVTHVVVRTSKDDDHMVHLDQIDRTEHDAVYLKCTVAELESMQRFTETHYVRSERHDYSTYQGGFYQSPYVTGVEEENVPVLEEQVPQGELAIHRGAKVAASDGNVGELEEFIVDGKTCELSHFILRKGHLWGKRNVTIPVSAVDHVEGDTVYLKLDKQAVEALPSIKVKHHYHPA